MVESNKLKVYYYGAHGAAQQIRYTLALGGLAFEDECPTTHPPSQEDRDKWGSLGKNTTTNVPMLIDGDKVYTQSSAVLRVAARKGGLMPTGDDELYQVDNLIAAAADLRAASYKAMAAFGASPAAQDDFVKNVMPKHVGNLERLFGDNEYFVGGKLSVADVAVYDVLATSCVALVPGCLTAFPKLDSFHKRIEALPKMAEYKKSE